jgi:hypothetical protein
VGGFPFLKRVIEDSHDPFLHAPGRVNGDGPADHEGKKANIIHSVKVVGVFMGVENTVDNTNPFPKQLTAQIGGGVDEEIPTRESKNCAAARSIVARIRTAANGTAAAYSRYPDACASP